MLSVLIVIWNTWPIQYFPGFLKSSGNLQDAVSLQYSDVGIWAPIRIPTRDELLLLWWLLVEIGNVHQQVMS